MTEDPQKAGREDKLPAQPFLTVSACFGVWVTVWVRKLTHILTHTISFKNRTKMPEILRFQAFFGAATQI